jgi:acetyltransferase-like isoleucine patch superfamily enzyme
MPRSIKNHLRIGMVFHLLWSALLTLHPRITIKSVKKGYFKLGLIAHINASITIPKNSELQLMEESLLIFGSEYGAYAKKYSRSVIHMEGGAKMEIDGEVWIGRGALVRILDGGKLKIKGPGTFLTANCLIVCKTNIKIGSNVQIAWNVEILDHDFHKTYELDGAQRVESSPIEIKDNVWIASGVKILKGVTVGTGCVIAANSVVTKNCDSGWLYGGAPARKIREIEFRG